MSPSRRPDSPARWFDALLRLLPAEFRGDFGADMRLDFRDELAAARTQGSVAVLRLWTRTVAGLASTAVRQHASDLAADTTLALRLMRRSPASTLVAVLMLAMGTGANAAVFSIIDGVLLQHTLPAQARLVMIQETRHNGARSAWVPAAHFERLETLSESPFAAIGAQWSGNAIWTDADPIRRVTFECVNAEMFTALGVAPRLGRVFTPAEDRTGADVVVLSDDFWRANFAAREDVVGRTMHLGSVPATIVGVMPRGFRGPRSRGEIWAPLRPALRHASRIGCQPVEGVNAVGLLRAGVSSAAAERELAARLNLVAIETADPLAGEAIVLPSWRSEVYGDVNQPFLALLGAVACVLLIACVNVATMQLERVVGRRHEMGIRLALGASRSRVIRQTLTETILLCLLGAMAGAGVAVLALNSIVDLMPRYIPNAPDIALNGRVLLATLMLAVVAGAAAGLVPAYRATRPNLAADLTASTRASTPSSRWPTRILVVTELALSLVLLVSAGLLLRTFLTLRPSSPGFDPSGKIVATLRFVPSAVPPSKINDFVQRASEDLTRAGLATAASATTYLPMTGTVNSATLLVEGAAPPPGARPGNVWLGMVTPNYLSEMRIPVLRGRRLSDTDGPGAPAVAVVNEAAAAVFWPHADPLGQSPTLAMPGRAADPVAIVGVLRNTRSLGGDLRARPEVYVPLAQSSPASLRLMIRPPAGFPLARLDAEIRASVARVAPGQVVDRVESLEAIVGQSVSTPRFGVVLLGTFAAMGLMLTLAGLGAAVARGVTQRSREIGVRLAIGATHRQILTQLLRESTLTAAAGVALGLGLAALSTRLIEGWLFGVGRLDPGTFVAAAAGLLLVSLVAAYVPARRTARIDPVRTLRES